MAFGKNITWKKGSNIIFPVFLGCWKEGKRTEIFREQIKMLKNGDGEEYQVGGNLIHPCPRIK